MRYRYWMRARASRLLVILLAVLVCIVLLVVDATRFFPHYGASFTTFFLPSIHFGFSVFVALMFLAVGSLVWLYARNRGLASLLFCFSFTMMVSSAVETGAGYNDPLLSAVANVSSVFSLSLFAILLLYFPKNYFLPRVNAALEDTVRPSRQFMLHVYVILLLFLSAVMALPYTGYVLLSLQPPVWLAIMSNIYNVFVLLGILATISISYLRATSSRERQQRRILVIGVILAASPLLFLTILPQVLNLPTQYVIDGSYTSLSVVLLPLALGYSILRYQIMVFDSYVRRAVVWIVGSISLAIVSYMVIILLSVLLSGNVSLYVIGVTVAMAVLAPCIWWLAQIATEYIFFSEARAYRQLIEKPDLVTQETVDIQEAARLLTLTAVNIFETEAVCLYVLDDDTGTYRLSPDLHEADAGDAARRSLSELITSTIPVTTPMQQEGRWVERHEPLLERVAQATRPLLLSEANGTGEEAPLGLQRYLAAESSGRDPLLSAVRAQGKMIGLLVLGERGDHQQYAGPDFEAIHLMLTRFSSILETARLYEQSRRHVVVLDTLYSAGTLQIKAFETLEEVAMAYAKIGAAAIVGSAGIWLYEEETHLLKRAVRVGAGPWLVGGEEMRIEHEGDWSTWFYAGSSLGATEGMEQAPSCLQDLREYPGAWIPLEKGDTHLGILTLTYPRPHVFSPEEKRVLEMFASQCATALENARITIELRQAYEQQKQLDHLKDQFIITASHELRTPLTAVQGYIELLNEYGSTLSDEMRTKFVEKAQLGCDELTLMVGNIMDASRVQIDAENVKVSAVPLAAAVTHVLEILEAMTRREDRTIEVDIPPETQVVADELRLRQVLLNIVSNALKYSPVGTSIGISYEEDEEHVTVRVRDQGLGVPVEAQEHLFERFMRLERDMNSPVRGAGLGLYISEQLVSAMGGRIWVESRGIAGEGSVFAFTLRRPTENAPHHATVQEHMVTSQSIS